MSVPLLIVLGLFALLLGVGAYLYRVVRRTQVEQAYELHRRIETLESDLRAVGAGAIGVGQRLLKVEQRLGATIDKQEALEQRDPAKVSYTEAGKLFEMGASTEEVMENCHISVAEARLIELMHRKNKTNA
ncbi:DUF2802 domain-containing protein [Aestuariirhabdus sp. LZHN29]|uniref:DUF2802 domain-containing protein n=1 Tax=Aestuariirhabdus sp. LZHN29 TaxID=3417462 RepID=UPI003CE6D03C